MTNELPQSEMLAVLLNLMGPDATAAALEGVPAETSRQVNVTLKEFSKQPPTQKEVDFVIDDFVKYFRFAMKTVDKQLEESGGEHNGGSLGQQPEPHVLQIAEEGFEVEIEPIKKFLPPSLTGDHAQDLNRLHPYQVAHAIRGETTVLIALVIQNLATEHAAKTLEYLPEALHPAVFLQMAQPSKVSDVVLDKIMATTIKLAMRVEKREPVTDAADQMVTLIRSVPKSIRVPMLEELQKSDEELSSKVKSQMYRFEDLSLLGDRDLQQILGKTSSDSLVLALQGADPVLIDRIYGNMSKRARESLEEEMSFKTNVKPEEIDSGREEVVRVLAELDESGAISLE